MELVLTAMSKDRPGIVEDIAVIITDHDGNWVQSSMARLGGEFAGIVQFTAPADKKDAMVAALKALDKKGIRLEIQEDQPDAETLKQTGQTAIIELTGLDHTGIVRDITHLLSQKGVTIDHLETDVYTASMAGQPMFYARAEIRLPEGLTIDALSQAAEAIAQDIMVDISLELEESTGLSV